MRTVHIDASSSYDVFIGNGILKHTGDHLSNIGLKGKAAIISDSNVFPIWGATVEQSLTQAGYQVSSIVFQAGESSKNQSTLFKILNSLAEESFTRSDFLVALGGGVTGDITGFAASVYLRGISYIQIPTSLLAMVDSSVGGKTAIDLAAGKNLVGAFYQPALVLCDLDVLASLPSHIFLDGCGEIIKYGILFDPALYGHLQEFGPDFDRSYVIPRCIELKRDVVTADEFDRGQRQLLNLGHTIGHGIEKQSQYTVSHGKAVAAGMAMITKAAWRANLCQQSTYADLCQVLKKFQLPITTHYSAQQLLESALSDKKRTGDCISLIFPRAPGDCIISPIPTENLQSIIEAGL